MTKCKILTREEEITFCNDYSNSRLSKKELIEKYQISDWTFTSIRERHNTPKRKRNAPKKNLIACDERFFEIIDTKEKAYWLGFIAADGCILQRKVAKSKIGTINYILSIGLATKDIEHLEKFKKDLKCEIPLRIDRQFHKQMQKFYETVYLRVPRTILCEDLMKQGVGRDKSKELEIPKLSDELMVHYLRGLFDGDAGFHINRTNSVQFSFISPIETFTRNIQLLLMNKCKLENETKITFYRNSYSFAYIGNIQCKRIYDYLYLNDGPWLDRKYKLLTDHFENLKNGVNTRALIDLKKNDILQIQSPLNILLFGDKNAK